MIERHTTERGLNLIAESTEKPYGVFLKHGSMELGYYKPNVTDRQQPHRQDEIYIIINYYLLPATHTQKIVIGRMIRSNGMALKSNFISLRVISEV